MQERAVTAAGQRFPARPFLRTRNPKPHRTGRHLPPSEARLDRFMFNTWVDYPSFDEEVNVVKQATSNASSDVKAVISGDSLAYQQVIRRMPVADNVVDYAVGPRTPPARARPRDGRGNQYLSWEPDLALAIPHCSGKGQRRPQHKASPDIEDVQAVATPILRHPRLQLQGRGRRRDSGSLINRLKWYYDINEIAFKTMADAHLWRWKRSDFGPKVFVIGYNKTGTTSVGIALKMLGYDHSSLIIMSGESFTKDHSFCHCVCIKI